MSYSAQAVLFFGIITTFEDLEIAFNLVSKEDNWDKIDNKLKENGINMVSTGNMLVGPYSTGLSINTIECEEDSPASISTEDMEIAPDEIEKFNSFLKKYKFKEKACWNLGAIYG